MDFQEFVMQNPVLVVSGVVGFILLVLGLGVVRGNLIVLYLFLRAGIPAYSGKMKKDFFATKWVNKETLGWLYVADTTYAPVMFDDDAKYKRNDYRNRASKYGELFKEHGETGRLLSSLALANKHPEYAFHDLSIITGSSMVRGANTLRGGQFTGLSRYIKSNLRHTHPSLSLIDNGIERKFFFLFAVEMTVEDKKHLAFSSREDFIKSLRDFATIDTKKSADGNILILKARTDIDTSLVFFIEGDESSGEKFA